MDIAAWLTQLGFSRYIEAFRHNDIDAGVLPELTGEDLQVLGVFSVGHRRRLLSAIRDLESATISPAAVSAPAERRRLTVMLVDLADSTALGLRLDPEDMQALLRRYQDAAAGAIAQVDGHVAKFVGDGILAYFGWPQAHEDDAERAVRAALAITAAVGRLITRDGTVLAARVGIATGPVVVGDVVGEGSAREETVVGDAPNLAARLQGEADPGGVVIADTTRRLLGGRFDLAPMEAMALKGFPELVTAWRVRGAVPGRGRFEALHGSPATDLLGRDQELELLLERWSRAVAGEGQAVLLVGEAGIGKSRLVRALLDRLDAGERGHRLWQCSPFHADVPLWPVARGLIDEGGKPTLAAVKRQLTLSSSNLAEAVPLLAGLLGLDPGSRYPASELGPEAQRDRLLTVIASHLLGLAHRQPLFLLIEDAHWSDASTLDLVRMLLDTLAAARILLVITSRPDGLPDLPSPPHLTRLDLSRLGRAAVAGMLRGLMAGEPASEQLVDGIVRRTDGVPLYVEELIKSLLERGRLTPDEVDTDEVPPSLHDTLMARLDRLGAAKEVAQLGACIGRDFDHRLLAAIADRPEAELAHDLAEVCAAELLFRRGTPPDAVYSFKHALVRDAAYASLLRSRRRDIHARILAAGERRVVPIEPAEAARHAACAEDWQKALHYYAAAGSAALDRAAMQEGMTLTGKALEAGAHLAGDVTAVVSMVNIRQARGWACLSMGDTVRLRAELQAAEAQSARLGMTRLTAQFRVQRSHAESIFGGQTSRAVQLGRQAGQIALRVNDSGLGSAARFVVGLAQLIAGDYRAAVAELEQDAEAYQDGLRMAAVGSSGTLAVDGLAVLGDAWGQLGRWDDALARARDAQKVAAETGIPWDDHIASYHLARTLLAKGDSGAARELIERNIAFGRRVGLPMVVARQQVLLGQEYLLRQDRAGAIDIIERSLPDLDAMRLQWTRTWGLLVLAEARLHSDRATASTAAGEALELARVHGYRALEARSRRIIGMACADLNLAKEHLKQAHSIAESLGIEPELEAIRALS